METLIDKVLPTSDADAMPTAWRRICMLDDIPVLGSRVVQSTTHGDIALFRTGDNEVFALRDRCPHKGGPLSQGIVHGRSVTCPLHAWRIALDTGEAAAPDRGCAHGFEVRLDGEAVFLKL